jgi:hypothetical protein
MERRNRTRKGLKGMSWCRETMKSRKRRRRWREK